MTTDHEILLSKINDLHVRSLQVDGLTSPFVDFSAYIIRNSYCVMIITNHTVYNWGLIRASSPAIVDCRNTLGKFF